MDNKQTDTWIYNLIHIHTYIRKSELKLLGVIVNEDPCNWDAQFEDMLSKVSSGLYILRVCRYYGFSLRELTMLFDSPIMSLFTYFFFVFY